MNRAGFLKSGTLLGAGSLLTTTNAFTQNLANNDIDKLVDANGNTLFNIINWNNAAHRLDTALKLVISHCYI